MYIWVILATFITILYSFNLSTRADMRKLYVEPQAEAVVAKLVEQHRAAQKYVRDHMPPDNGSSTVSYHPGEVSFANLKPYLPYGFNGSQTNSEYTTLLYCLDRTSDKFSQAMTGCTGSGPSCCGDAKSITYLATFGCVPQKWRNIRTGRPNNDMLNAIQNIVGMGTDMGYADFVSPDDPENGLKTTMMIRAREVTFVSIPQYIISNRLNGVEEGRSFSEMCGDGVKGNDVSSEAGSEDTEEETPDDVTVDSACNFCLIYLTPFD